METQSNPRERLEDLSSDKLVSLLRSTYEYKNFVRYYDDHDVTFLHNYEHNHPNPSRKTTTQGDKAHTDSQIMRELQLINKQNNLKLHNYHLELIFSKFDQYYGRYEEQKARKIKADYEHKIRKVEKEGESLLPEQLMEICLQKERSLTKQLQTKKKNIRL